MRDVTVEDDAAWGRHGPVVVRRYRCAAEATAQTLVWVHGGAFAWGNLDMPESDAVARALAAAGRPVIAVDYRRVPRWSRWREPGSGSLPGVRYPLPVDDVVDVLEWVQAERGSAVLGGASAGACLAAAATLRQVRGRRATPAALVLAYGIFHSALPAASLELRGRIRSGERIERSRITSVNRMNRNYAGSPEAMHDAFAFPGGHNLAGMPPTLVLDADRDYLRASSERFAQELAEADVDVSRHVIAKARHGFLNKPASSLFTEGINYMAGWLGGDRP
ncbi:alpha/beta hydrolase [Arthrobacter sp. HS15c]|uniref:alpha/beta hydrolase n=1 Tax=Arthrobacter sp. HS15c TaxID=3230279 RepID=UPI0034670DC6